MIPAVSGWVGSISAAGNAAACTIIPATISGLRPITSDSWPVTSCPAPHSSGYRPLISPIAASPRPREANSNGNTPQVRPSLRLFTNPA